VASLDKSLAEARKRGGTVLREPRSSGGGRFAVVRDPAGAVCALYQNVD
jgi:predicted enzyme related to lactoylglutathione lyase